MCKKTLRFLGVIGAAVLCVAFVPVASADLFELGEDWAIIGNAGNPNDTTGYGRVDYTYAINKYPVTAGEYRDFLNAVDPNVENELGLWNSSMAKQYGCMITRNADENTYDFSGIPSGTDESEWVNLPVNFVSWYDAARYANWMTTGDTETGPYQFNDGDFIGINREGTAFPYGWIYVLPTADEWYKGAYHKNDGVTDNYWDYPMGSDDLPSNVLADPPEDDPGNNANFDLGGWTVGSPHYRTTVGAFMNSASPYGTFDQGGNVWEWTESPAGNGSQRYQFGGAWDEGRDRLKAGYLRTNAATVENDISGFRLAAFYYIPEPGSATLLLFAAIGGLLWRRR